MTRIIDEDIIRQHPVSDAYREGWERTFGDKDAPPEPSKDAMTVVLTQPVVNATFQVPVNPDFGCEHCRYTGCVVDPDIDPNTVQTEGDLLMDCPYCSVRGNKLP